MVFRHVAVFLGAVSTGADRPEDLVASLPGFPDASTWGFKAYSGRLSVPGWGGQYDSLKIHYQFHISQRDAASDPVVAWHQGGPGGSSITVGLYAELGALIVGENGNYVNPHAWNRVANMLYLESPAGSHNVLSRTPDGFSECIQNGQAVDYEFDDRSQAEAYAHTLQAFFTSFPEYKDNDFYLTGESYFGQFGPNIAHFIINTEPFASSIQLRGLALGNACWGGDEDHVQCNGPNAERNDVELFHGKGLFSPKLYQQINEACDFQTPSKNCSVLLSEMHREVGPHNVYNIYDNCPKTEQYLRRTGKDMRWLVSTLREGMHEPLRTHAKLLELGGGFPYDCMGDDSDWITRADVMKALHLDGATPGASRLHYKSSGPASITLYPELVRKLRITIYNGDADSCVPYIGNEEWIGELEAQGVLKEKEAWTPWFAGSSRAPAGYITKYSVPGTEQDFNFVTVRLAGHMVPQYQPEAAFVMISSYLNGTAGDRTVASAVV